jgi:hypothetical protein
MSDSLAQAFGPKHPAFPKFLQSPEILLGVGGIALIIYATFTYALQPLFTAGDKLGTDIQTEQATLQKNQETKAKIERLKSEAEANPTALLTLNPGEIDSVKVYDYIQSLQALSDKNTLGLPEPHSQVYVLGAKKVDVVTANGSAAPAPAPTDPNAAAGAAVASGANIFVQGIAPFSITDLSDLNLNVNAQQHRYEIEALGTYIGLLDFVRRMTLNSPFVGIRKIDISVDEEAPNVLKFAPNTAPVLKDGKGDSKVAKPSSAAKAGAPLRMKLEVDLFLKESPAIGAEMNNASTADAGGTALSPAAPTTF